MKRKLKSFVVPSIYVLSIVLFVFSLYFIQDVLSDTLLKDKSLFENQTELVDKEIIEQNNYLPVVSNSEIIIKPFTVDSVKVVRGYYDYTTDSAQQESSIIYYENTYMQNSGIDYSSETEFDVVSILEGTVIDVKSDNVLGNIVEIRHTNELISVYQSLSEVTVKVDDKVVKGQIIGKSGESNINRNTSNNLHFELYYKGQIVNPEEYYDKNLTDL